MISESKCETLNSTWSNVLTDPSLPVGHGVEITFTCPTDYVNKGGSRATCEDGNLVPTTTPPQCFFIGMNFSEFCFL